MAELTRTGCRRAHVKALSAAKRGKLGEGLLLAQFRRDAAEAEAWVGSRRKQLEAQEASLQAELPSSLEEKVKQLQKHQAFQAELAAHEGNIVAIRQASSLFKAAEEPPWLGLSYGRKPSTFSCQGPLRGRSVPS